MNEKLKDFILGLGALTEMWMITYNSFRKQGLTHSDALEHTERFTKTVLAYSKDIDTSDT